MPNDLPHDFVGPPIVSFGATFLQDQAFGTELLELFTDLKIAAATESELFGCSLGSEFTFPFEQHRQTAREFIVLRDEQCADTADESVFFEVKDRHHRSSLTRYKKRAITGGRRVLKTATLHKINMAVEMGDWKA